MSFRKAVVSFALLSCVAAGGVQAQNWGSYGGAYGTRWGSSTQAWGSIMTQDMFARSRIMNKFKDYADGQAVAPAAAAPLTARELSAASFAPGPRIMPNRMAADLPAQDRGEGAMVYHEMLNSYEQFVAENGETARFSNNVAGSLAYMLTVSNYILTNGQELSDDASEALLRDVFNVMKASPEFRNASASQKQELYELFAIQGTLALTLFLQGHQAGDASLVEQGRQMARDIQTSILGTSVN